MSREVSNLRNMFQDPMHHLKQAMLTPKSLDLVSCTNSRFSDLAAAAKVFKDAAKETGESVRIADGVSFYIAAASMPEQQAAEESGDWQVMLDAGAAALPSGCGPCIVRTSPAHYTFVQANREP